MFSVYNKLSQIWSGYFRLDQVRSC